MTVDPFKRRDVLNQAADLIEQPASWCQGTTHLHYGPSNHVAYCALGAIRKVMGGYENGHHDSQCDGIEYQGVLASGMERDTLVGFNDAWETTAQKVASYLRDMASKTS